MKQPVYELRKNGEFIAESTLLDAAIKTAMAIYGSVWLDGKRVFPTVGRSTKQRWTSPIPEQCQLCHADITAEFWDTALRFGHWAYTCNACHAVHGVRPGQRYRREEDGFFFKVEG